MASPSQQEMINILMESQEKFDKRIQKKISESISKTTVISPNKISCRELTLEQQRSITLKKENREQEKVNEMLSTCLFHQQSKSITIPLYKNTVI